MTLATKPLEDLIRELPPALQAEARNFVESLLDQQAQPPQQRKLRQDWAGALRAYRGEYTALELQTMGLE